MWHMTDSKSFVTSFVPNGTQTVLRVVFHVMLSDAIRSSPWTCSPDFLEDIRNASSGFGNNTVGSQSRLKYNTTSSAGALDNNGKDENENDGLVGCRCHPCRLNYGDGRQLHPLQRQNSFLRRPRTKKCSSNREVLLFLLGSSLFKGASCNCKCDLVTLAF
jgi:hypothetical protein